MLQEFDSANTFESAHVRTNTVTAAQALDLLNNDLVLEWGRAFAGEVLNGLPAWNTEEQIARAFRIAYGREVTGQEQKTAVAFLKEQSAIMVARLAGGDKTKPPLPTRSPEGMEPSRAAAFVDFCHMLLASNEFLYVN